MIYVQQCLVKGDLFMPTQVKSSGYQTKCKRYSVHTILVSVNIDQDFAVMFVLILKDFNYVLHNDLQDHLTLLKMQKHYLGNNMKNSKRKKNALLLFFSLFTYSFKNSLFQRNKS